MNIIAEFLKKPLKLFVNDVSPLPISEKEVEGIHPIFLKFPKLQLELEPGEKYYESVDVLEAMDRAQGTFVMFEVGAGRAVRGQIAMRVARTREIPVSFFMVEGEPYRAQKEIPEVMSNLGVPSDSFRVFPYCLGKNEKDVIFYFSSKKQDLSLGNWLGQSKILEEDTLEEWTDRIHMGHKIGISKYGYEAIIIQQIKFSKLFKEVDAPVIDLCDFDIQGSELEVIQESIKLLNKRVKRLHIGTHGLQIERKLLRFLKKHRWQLLRYYPCHSDVETDFGKAHFIDGVQTWLNPRFKH